MTIAKDKKVRDNGMLTEMTNVKNQIVESIRKNYFNLFTCAYSLPLVKEDVTQGIVPCADTIKSTFDVRMELNHQLEETNKQFQVNYDILSEDLLKSVAEHGTRVLHISSDMIDEDSLCVERDFGVARFLSLSRIEQLLKPHTEESGRLPMDLVCIAIPSSRKIGEVFDKLGVPHVLTFDLNLPAYRAVDKFRDYQLNPYRFNYIYGFCITFYAGLAAEMTVIDAFKHAEEAMKDETTQLEYVWRLNDKLPETIAIEELGIVPVLIKADKSRHTCKLYDSKQPKDSVMRLKDGLFIDTSKQRGQLAGMKKAKTSYIG